MDIELKIWKSKTFEGLSVEFLSVMCHFKKLSVYLKSSQFLQNIKNPAGDKLKLPKRQSPAGIGGLGMSDKTTSKIRFEVLLVAVTFSVPKSIYEWPLIT